MLHLTRSNYPDNIVNARFSFMEDNCSIELFHVDTSSSRWKIVLVLYPIRIWRQAAFAGMMSTSDAEHRSRRLSTGGVPYCCRQADQQKDNGVIAAPP